MKKAQTSEEIDNLDKTTLLLFSASWCGPCQKLKPQLEELDLSVNNQPVEILYVDVDDEFDIVDELDISTIPSLFIYNPNCISKENVFCSSDIDEVTNYLTQNNVDVKVTLDFFDDEF